jgi:hypothetical protein
MPITSKDITGNAPKAATPKAEEPKAEAPAPKKVTKSTVFVANQTGVTNVGGSMFQFRSGVTHVTADDPAYKAHPELFNPAEDSARPVVEQATAAPGEARGEPK